MIQWIDYVTFILVASVFSFFAFLLTITAINLRKGGDHDE